MDNSPEAPRGRLAVSIVVVLSAAALGILAESVVEVWSQRQDVRGEREFHLQPTEVALPLVIPPDVPVLPEVLSAEDADVHNGMWFVLDGTAGQIHRLSSSGELLGSFGRRGEGPGEFRRRPAAVAVHGDTIAVMEYDGRHLHLFDPDGASVADRSVRLDSCPVSAVSELISLPLGLAFLVICTQENFRQEIRVILESRSGFLQTVATRTHDEQGSTMLGGFTWSILSAHPNGFVFGSNTDECLGVYNVRGDILASTCHDWIEAVPIPEELSDAVRDRLSARPEIRGTLPESLFPFFGVFVTPDNRWIYRVLASNEPESYVLATFDQELPIPRARYVFVHEESVLVGWEDLEGTRVTIYPLEDR